MRCKVSQSTSAERNSASLNVASCSARLRNPAKMKLWITDSLSGMPRKAAARASWRLLLGVVWIVLCNGMPFWSRAIALASEIEKDQDHRGESRVVTSGPYLPSEPSLSERTA
jgi:hypothetical protein